VLGIVLIAAGLTIMNKANGDLIPWVMVAAGLAVGALFAVQIALRKEVEHDPWEQERCGEPPRRSPSSETRWRATPKSRRSSRPGAPVGAGPHMRARRTSGSS